MMQPKHIRFYCVECGKESVDLIMKCGCGGMIETRYEYPPQPLLKLRESLPLFQRFWPVLPIADPSSIQADIRPKTQTRRAVHLQHVCGGPELWFQDETTLPTGTTKDRVAATVFPFFRQFGVHAFVVSSTGNTSSSFAYMAQFYPDMQVHIFVGKDFAYRLRHITSSEVVTQPNVVIHIIDGNFVQAGTFAKQFADNHHLLWEGGFFNPARRDGLKTAFLEATLHIGKVPTYYVQAVSSAMGVIATAKAAQELPVFGFPASTPRLVCVQQESCAPMVQAWNDGSSVICHHHKVAHPAGIAKAILRGDPSGTYPIIYKAVKRSQGRFVAASESEIKYAQKLLYELEGLWVCEAAACALAGYLKLLAQDMIVNDGPVVINLTGGDNCGLSL